MSAPTDCSWSIRGIMKHHKKARELIRHLDDVWRSSVPLLEDDQAIQQLNLPLNTKVSAIIKHHKWSSVITDLPKSDLKNKILAVDINQFLEKDEIVWTPTPAGKFKSKSTMIVCVDPKTRLDGIE